MKTTGDIVRERYQKHIQGAEKVTRAVALFALQMACADIEEVWQDEYAGVLRKLETEQGWATAQTVALEKMGRFVAATINELEQTQLRCVALEGECERLINQMSELSARTIASMGSCEPAASSTSSTEAATPSALAASSTASADPAAPASSAPTSRPRRRPKGETGDGVTGEEVGDTTGLDPTRAQPPSPHLAVARRLLTNPAELDRQVEMLKAGEIQWRDNPRPLRLAILAHVWLQHWSKVSEFDQTRPPWMPTAGAISSISTNNRWSEIVLSILELKAPPSATQA